MANKSAFDIACYIDSIYMKATGSNVPLKGFRMPTSPEDSTMVKKKSNATENKKGIIANELKNASNYLI